MSLVMLVEVQTVDGTAYFLVLQDALSTIAKRYDCHTLTANGYRSSQVIHLSIANLGRDVAVCPGIEDTSTINT